MVIAVALAMLAALWLARNEQPMAGSTTLTIANPGSKPPTLPRGIALLAMLRGTFLAVDHGLKSGNFTVLRDLGSSKFRKANSASRLAQIFAELSSQNVDLLATAVVEPTFTKSPAITSEKMLYLTGLFSIEPRAVAFEVLLELEDGEWRIFAIAIAPAAG